MSEEDYIYQVLSVHQEGLLLSVLSNFLSTYFKCSIDTAREFILQMFRDGNLVSKSKTFKNGETNKEDFLLFLPDSIEQ